MASDRPDRRQTLTRTADKQAGPTTCQPTAPEYRLYMECTYIAIEYNNKELNRGNH